MKDASMDITAQLVALILGFMSAAAVAYMRKLTMSDRLIIPARDDVRHMKEFAAACAVYDLSIVAADIAGWPHADLEHLRTRVPAYWRMAPGNC